jgi:hypothetical protein
MRKREELRVNERERERERERIIWEIEFDVNHSE